jgi:hypothetical protein
MLVVAKNLLSGSVVDHRQICAPTPNRGEFFAQWVGMGPPGLASESLAQRDHDGVSQGLAGARREFSSKPVCLGVLDAQRHVEIIYE